MADNFTAENVTLDEELKITAPELEKLGAIDEIVPEKNLMANLKKSIVAALKELQKLSVAELLDRRYAKFTGMGRFKPQRI